MFVIIYTDSLGTNFLEFDTRKLAIEWIRENVPKLFVKKIYKISKEFNLKVNLNLKEVE